MEWHYVSEGQNHGPISQSEFDALRRSGTIRNDTLVWRDGWKSWHPLGKVVTTPSAPPPGSVPPPPLPAATGTARCAECQQLLPKEEMMAFEHNFVCAACKPLFLQKIREGLAPGSADTLWRSGRQLVTSIHATLPDRCVKCNAPSDGRPMLRKLYWHHPALYILILPGLLIYALVAIAVRNTATIRASLCPEHRSRRKRAILIAWVLVVAGVIGFILAASSESGWGMLVGGLAFLAGMITAIVGTSLLSAKKIDKQNAWVAGCCPEFLAAFPEWPGPR